MALEKYLIRGFVQSIEKFCQNRWGGIVKATWGDYKATILLTSNVL